MTFDPPLETAREAVWRLARSDLDPQELMWEVCSCVQRAVPHDAWGWTTLDPDTFLPSGTHQTGKSPELIRALWHNEQLQPDVNKIAEIARRRTPVGALSDLDPALAAESTRIQLIHGPAGIGDELRVVMRTGRSAWGAATLYREAGAPNFSAQEREFMVEIAQETGEGLRRSLARRPRPDVAVLVPGVVTVGTEGGVVAATDEARRLIALMPGGSHSTLFAVALSATRDGSARARVRLIDGQWLLVYGSRLTGSVLGGLEKVTVTLVPAPSAELTPLLMRLHGLSAREREVARLLMLGPPTEEIAERLHISPHTLRDHTKAIFAKVGATSRAELIAFANR